MKFDDHIPCRDASDADADSPYVAALRPIAPLAFAPMCNIKTGPCQLCGKPMLLYSRRLVCSECYPAEMRRRAEVARRKLRAKRRMEAKA